jgi:hypothetical protein
MVPDLSNLWLPLAVIGVFYAGLFSVVGERSKKEAL